MNRFSSEYWYIFNHAFADDFWIALLSSGISLFFGVIAIVLILSIIGLILMVKLDKSEGRGRYKLVQGTGMFVLILLPLFLISTVVSFASTPDMYYVKFNKEHADKIYALYYQDKIEEYKKYPRYTASRLEDGVVHHKKSWAINGKYKELETVIYKKYPDAQRDVIYHQNVYQILNKKFLVCFNNATLNISQSLTINDMNYNIGLQEEKCLNKAAAELIDEINNSKE